MTDDALLAEFIELLPRSRAATRLAKSGENLEALYAAFPEGTPRLLRLYERLILSWEWK